MLTLAIDVGTSSVKAAIVDDAGPDGGRVVSESWEKNPSINAGDRVEHDARKTLRSLTKAIRSLGGAVSSVDTIVAAVMSPAWVALDARGQALTPVVGHQDRRSLDQARFIESKIGKDKHLSIVGNRPVQGAISSTTTLWFKQHHSQTIDNAHTLCHLQTWLLAQLTGEFLCDPSTASFTGFYRTTTLDGYDGELLDCCGIDLAKMPPVRQANERAGHVTDRAASTFGLRQGTPVLVGCMDTSAAMVFAGLDDGQLINTAGTTDVLGTVVSRCTPDPRVLTRALGVGGKWMSVSTIPAAGAVVEWAISRLLTARQRKYWIDHLSFEDEGDLPQVDLGFAGSRTSIEQTFGSISNLKLSTTSQDILKGVVVALSIASAARFELLASINAVPLKPDVLVTGGYASLSQNIQTELYRRWPEGVTRRHNPHATFLGLAKLSQMR